MRTFRAVSTFGIIFGLVFVAACEQATTDVTSPEAGPSASQAPVQNGHVSGGVSVTWDAPNRSRGDIDLTAHEGPGNSPERGAFEWEAYDDNGDLAREMTITVREVDVSGSSAKFLAEVTFDSRGTLVGDWYAFYAGDGGSPGPGNDEIRWTNSSTRSGLPGGGDLSYANSDLPDRFTIVDGNLTVQD